MEIIFSHAWIMFLIVTLINGVIFNVRIKSRIKGNPELEKGYKKLLRGWFIYGSVPWLIMAIGDITGYVTGIWDFFNLKTGNPIVLIFHAYLVFIYLLGSKWIFLDKGAEFLCKHPGFIRINGLGYSSDITSPTTIKLFWGLALAGGIVGMAVMWNTDIPGFHI